ncbi:MAG: ABC transporter ATP-binding protein [Planktomarina sp.]|nr:ABC transporter ATP-binding protein [Planktomarina sp.]|tara:strand:+ start:2977 stop:3945 length:969 start_codon:yes stop_codon:yes gene_type:complete
MLTIRDLKVTIAGHTVAEVEMLEVREGQRLGLVGESGSGKSMIVMSILGLQPKSASITGSITFNGQELIGLSDKKMANIRGSLIGLVPQDPTKSLNPTMRIGKQIAEAITLHSSIKKNKADQRVRELISNVRLPDPDRILRSYPHQLSGGQQQRVLIAMAIASNPMMLIADEPTTALDVTVQGEILQLILTLSRELGMGLIFVSHELGVVRFICDEIAVIYGGHVFEIGPAHAVVNTPLHRYTEALISANIAMPKTQADIGREAGKLQSIDGSVPALGTFPNGCRFRNRCVYEITECALPVPMQNADGSRFHRCRNPISEKG